MLNFYNKPKEQNLKFWAKSIEHNLILPIITTEDLILLFKLLSWDPHLNSVRNVTLEAGQVVSLLNNAAGKVVAQRTSPLLPYQLLTFPL